MQLKNQQQFLQRKISPLGCLPMLEARELAIEFEREELKYSTLSRLAIYEKIYTFGGAMSLIERLFCYCGLFWNILRRGCLALRNLSILLAELALAGQKSLGIFGREEEVSFSNFFTECIVDQSLEEVLEVLAELLQDLESDRDKCWRLESMRWWGGSLGVQQQMTFRGLFLMNLNTGVAFFMTKQQQRKSLMRSYTNEGILLMDQWLLGNFLCPRMQFICSLNFYRFMNRYRNENWLPISNKWLQQQPSLSTLPSCLSQMAFFSVQIRGSNSNSRRPGSTWLSLPSKCLFF